MSLPNCPKCNSEYVYEDGIFLVCPECAYEWDPNEVAEEEGLVVLDSNGTRLADGDTVTVIKDLKVKGAPKDIKQGTRVKNIRLLKVTTTLIVRLRFWCYETKSEFVRKI
ncbi:MAG: zinc ribbon domain-containing protein YjdM [Streptococcus sp.]